ncbi:MAG: DedA family protein [Pseudomonadales bacterium]|nr:DedA family protein [Pseudomonadales bacterium]
MVTISVYIGLFLSAFGAATLLPLQSESVLVGLILSKKYSIYVLFCVATVGNVLGSVINWLLGYYIDQLRHKSWFPVKAAQMEKAQQQYQRYGHWSLLLSWVPVIGDPLTLVAGILREPFWKFLLLVTVAKGARYLVLALLVPQI